MGIANSPDILPHAERLLPEVQARLQSIQEQTSEAVRKVVLEVVFADTEIKGKFEGMEIRGTSMCCVVAKRIMEVLGHDPNSIGLMAIGDVTLPDFIRPTVDKIILERAPQIFAEITRSEEMDHNYDLMAQGYKPAREMALNKWDRSYKFSDHEVEEQHLDPKAPGGTRTERRNLKEVLATNSTIMPGGMAALKLIVDSLNEEADNQRLTKRYIYPDNSFGTWKSIVNKSSKKKIPKKIIDELPQELQQKFSDRDLTEFHQLKTEQADNLQLTPEAVHKFYHDHPAEGNSDTWYITPVSNPSGTKISGENLLQTCEAIIQLNPKATIILDCVYLRTLEVEQAQDIICGVIGNSAIMDRAIFIESLSKTHGITGHRVGMYFSQNKKIFNMIQNSDTTFTAGHGHFLSALMMAFMEGDEATDEKFKELHRFWARERKGLFNYLVGSGKYNNLFEEQQDHITPEQIDDPLGLYLLLKLKDGVTPMQVWTETGSIGVPTKLDTGLYMRFSVGMLTEETYASVS
ncbi:MAG: aminotransferase class I/II-fold pyridoxal phosphate-dependent enzyme [Candidatus Gracilibacteria bacterium]